MQKMQKSKKTVTLKYSITGYSNKEPDTILPKMIFSFKSGIPRFDKHNDKGIERV